MNRISIQIQYSVGIVWILHAKREQLTEFILKLNTAAGDPTSQFLRRQVRLRPAYGPRDGRLPGKGPRPLILDSAPRHPINTLRRSHISLSYLIRHHATTLHTEGLHVII
eukprot:COSAG02_NODE_2406_length_8930_cov_10.414676_8_plen_110_part_00